MGVAYICRGMAMVPEPMHMTMHGGGGDGGGWCSVIILILNCSY